MRSTRSSPSPTPISMPLVARAGQAAGTARQARCLEPRQPSGSGHGRAALSAWRIRPIKVLSGGEKRRVALTRLLLSEPDILLLDEPTNHLDAESVAWLEHHLREYEGTVIAVTHDRYFLDNVAGWILELDRGYGIPWKGNYSSWLEQKQERVPPRKRNPESKRQKTLERELEWIRMSPKARQSKGKARVTAYEELLSQEGRNAPRRSGNLHPTGTTARRRCL